MSILQTHFLYVAIILFSTTLIWIAERTYSKTVTVELYGRRIHIQIARCILYLVVYIVLVVPLVQRTCGIDTEVYYFDYEHDRMYNFDRSFSYLLLFLHTFIPNPKIGLGIVSALTVALSMFSILRLRGRIDVPLAFFAYASCIYFYSYNYMRMLFAVSLVFVGYSFCVEERRTRAIIPFALAALFHLSTILVLAIHILLMLAGKQRLLLALLFIVGLTCFLLTPTTFLGLVSVDRYSSQISANQMANTIGLGTMIRVLPPVCFLLIYRNRYKTDLRFTWIEIFILANVAFSFLGYYVGAASRISNILLTYHLVFGLPLLLEEDKLVERRRSVRYLFIGYCIILYVLLANSFATMMIVPYS